MRRVSPPEPRTAVTVEREEDPRGWLGAAAFAAVAALAVLALYVVHPLVRGIRLPIGPDGPVYVWWARFAEAAGLGAVPRPGIPALTLFLGAPVEASPLQVVAMLGPVLAAAVALAGVAAVESLLGPDRLRAGAAAVLVGGFAGHLAAGWLASLAVVGVVLGAVAVLGAAERSWRPAGLAGGVLAAGVTIHSAFLVVGLGVLGGALILLVPEVFRRLRAGEAFWRLGPVRIGVAVGLGGGVGFLGLAALGAPTAVPGSTSQDHLLRRLGGEGFLLDRYRERLTSELRRLAAPLVAGAALALGGMSRRPIEPGVRLFWAVTASWTLVTVAGAVALHATGRGPGARMLTFAFFLPLAAAAGFARLWRGRRPTLRALAAVAGLLLLAGSLWSWYRQGPFLDPDELRAARAAGAAVAALPEGTPLIFLVDTTELAAGFHIARFGNVLRSGLPPERIPDMRLVVGGPDRFLEGLPGDASEDPEYVHIAGATLAEVASLRDEAAVFVVRPFNRPGFEAGGALGREVAPDVAQIAGPQAERVGSLPAPGGLGPGELIGLSVAALALLALLGGGWARWGLPGAPRHAVAALGPSVGLAVAVVAALAADRLGFSPGGPVAWGLAGVLGATGYATSLFAGDDAVNQLEHP